MKFLKLAIVTVGALTALNAAAVVKHEVRFVRSVSFDGKTLSGAYAVSGGCAEHRAEIDVEIVKVARDGWDDYKALVKVYDVTDQGDDCEAMVGQSFSAELRTVIEKKAAAAGFRGNTIDLVLPQVMVQW